ncbi:MAG: hypothetical protein MUC88_14765 [Planctomycetes bacterium]|jgi:tetratricopeptide (TPR) repeat protein|nr:hypothetical protein [Planctomycetota bacterium]
MEDRLIIQTQRRERRQEHKELAAKSCYSVIIVLLALLVLRPLLVDQILSRAEAFRAAGRLEESQRQCDKALLLDDDSSRTWAQLARIHQARSDRALAYAAYEKAVQADPTNCSARFELAMMYIDDEQHPLAVGHLEQVRRLGLEKTKACQSGADSYHRAALHMLLLCYEKVGNPAKAEMTREEIRVFYPNCQRDAALAGSARS